MTQDSERYLKVWRLGSVSVRIEKADPTLAGKAPLEARRYCGPYMHANGAGYYLFSPVDLDLSYDPRRKPRWIWESTGRFYDDDELTVMRRMKVKSPRYEIVRSKPRTKIHLSGVHDQPQHTAQIWTGCVFQTPPGWALWIRDPVNREHGRPFRVQEAILETDWLRSDIWINLEFVRWGEVAGIRHNGSPLAQLIPIHHESYAAWHLEQALFSSDDKIAQAAFDQWIEFNWEKYYSRGDYHKDSMTYYRWRKNKFLNSEV
jgi:hypothetical protein